ncbi:MAG: hypothetical protein AAF909_03430 [Pseudomonadota bacterium]
MSKQAHSGGSPRLGRGQGVKRERPLPRLRVALGVAVVAGLAGCGGAVDPNRPPLPRDYSPPPIDGFPDTDLPSRI